MNSKLENLVWRRAQRICEYCRMPAEYDELPFQIDHVLARKHGGQTVARNLALACFSCNSHKGPNIAGRDSKTGRIVRLFNPRRDSWAEHFHWEGAWLAGLTAIGRATIAVLEINLSHRATLRQALIEEGFFHPAITPKSVSVKRRQPK